MSRINRTNELRHRESGNSNWLLQARERMKRLSRRISMFCVSQCISMWKRANGLCKMEGWGRGMCSSSCRVFVCGVRVSSIALHDFRLLHFFAFTSLTSSHLPHLPHSLTRSAGCLVKKTTFAQSEVRAMCYADELAFPPPAPQRVEARASHLNWLRHTQYVHPEPSTRASCSTTAA